MTLHLQYATLPFGGFTQVDVSLIDELRHQVSDSHPAVLRFRYHAANYTTPIPRLAFIQFWDDANTNANGNLQTESNPAFEGYVEEVNPSDDGLSIGYTAYDATRRAAQQITIMDTPWEQGAIVSGSSGTRPVPGLGAVPRLILNCLIDNDPDYAHSIDQDFSVGGIIQLLLEYQYQPLYWLRAARGDGSAAGNGTAYRLDTASGTGTAMELGGMDFEPQEKMVFESESLRSGIARLMQMYAPNYRTIFEPGQRHWRFYDINDATQVTLTLNDFTGTYKVLSCSLDPSLEERATAVKIYGPKTTIVAAPGGEGDVDAFTTLGSAPSLAPLGDGILLQNYSTAGGSFEAIAYTRWQIVDSTKRRGAKQLSRTVTVPMASPRPDGSNAGIGYEFIPVKSPCLQISFDGGTTWITVLGTFFDFQNGIADCVNPIYAYYNPAPLPPSTQQFFPPNAVRLIWAYNSDPLSVRKPASGFDGTAYSVANLESVLDIYDESLACGYEYGTAVTSTVRRAKFETLAQQVLDNRKDIAWTGGCVLEGLKYDFAMLQKRINFTSETAEGAPLTTGWEDINAILTDVEFDYTNQVTTLTFSSDQLALMRVDSEQLKERLKIKALEQVTVYSVFLETRTFTSPYQTKGPLTEIAGTTTLSNFEYRDPDTGELG